MISNSPARRTRVLIVDDEPLGREALRLALSVEPTVEIVGECASGADAIVAIGTEQPDVLLLDVRMPEIDGFDVIRALRPEHRPVIIFVTASHTHARHAFDSHALDYVLKPFDDARLLDAIRRAQMTLKARDLFAAAGEFRFVLDLMGVPAQGEYLDRIAVKRDGGMYFVRMNDVDYIEAASNYVHLYSGATRHVVRSTLRALLARLDPRRFCRIHKSIVVNVDRVREVNPWMGGDYTVVLQDNVQLRASRTHVSNLLRPFR